MHGILAANTNACAVSLEMIHVSAFHQGTATDSTANNCAAPAATGVDEREKRERERERSEK